MAKTVYTLKVLLMAVGIHLLVSYWTDEWQGDMAGQTEPQWMGIEVESVPEGRLNWCNSTDGQVQGVKNLMCNFHHLCFSGRSKQFLIFHHGRKQEGELQIEPHYRTVPLTTAVGVEYWFEYLEVPENMIHDRDLYTYKYYNEGKYHILARISDSNTAHDIHDVLLPVFQTFTSEERQGGPSRTLIGFFRDKALGESEPLYRVLSREQPIVETDFDFQPKESLYCFEDVTVGLPRKKLWYQWGLNGAPESPLSNLNVTAEDIRMFTSYVIGKMNIDVQCDGREHVVLFSRKRNRRLINEKNLSSAVSKEFNMNVIEVSLERTPIAKIIETMACAKLALGLHGALQIFAMFMPRDSVLFEIFPYAINPENHTPYKTMASLPGMDIEYIAWRNMNQSASVLNKQFDRMFNINHLSEDEQKAIYSRSEVPPKLCCNDSEWKYRIYHDTIIDIPSVLDALGNSKYLKKLTRNSEL